jgi:hypothetical protein
LSTISATLCDLGRRHQSARRHHDKHDVKHPENRGAQCFPRRVATRRLRYFWRGNADHLAGFGCPQNPGQDKNDPTLDQPKPKKCCFVARGGNNRSNWNDSQRSACTVTRRGKTDGQAAPIGKPLNGLTDASGIHGSASGAADHGTEIQHFEGLRIRIDNPTESDQDSAGRDHQLGPASLAEAINNPTMYRREPGFEGDKDAERELDRCDRPAMRLVDGVNKKRPAVLQVGDQYHAQDAANELSPARCRKCAQSRVNCCCRHVSVPLLFNT